MSRLLARLGVVTLTAAVTMIVGNGPIAAAHVSVHADEAVAGESAEITFRVPTESDTASTVRLRVQFPEDSPIAEVAVLPQAGWTSQVTRKALTAPMAAGHGHEVSEVVSQLEWRAENREAATGPGEYQEFRIVAGPLPRTDRLVFKAVQTYDDGQVQRWIEEPIAGAPEPEHPAPVLAIGGHDEVAAVVPTSAASTAPTWAAVVVSLVAMIAALGALLVALRLNMRTRQQQ